jgi:cysteine desulfurase / selenocysteine lyase
MLYFDHGATSYPKPKNVIAGMIRALEDFCANPGRAGHQSALQASREIYDAREVVAGFFNIKDPKQLIFTLNCTEALNLGIKGVLKSGDHVITTSMEHNSVLRPIKALEKEGVENTIIQCNKDGSLPLEKVDQSIQENTRLIVLTHSSNLTGTLMPIAEVGKIARERGILFLVDAAQTAGLYPIDVEKMYIDLLAAPGHKSLLGPQGSGFLYIKEGLYLKTLKEGGTGSKSQDFVQPDILPDRYESGTPNTPGIIGLKEGIQYIQQQGRENLLRHEESLVKYFLQEVSKLDYIEVYGPKDCKKQSPVVALNFRGMDSSEIAYILDSVFNIAVRPGLHCAPLAHKTIGTLEQGAVRFSFGYSTTMEEVAKGIEAIKTIGSEL